MNETTQAQERCPMSMFDADRPGSSISGSGNVYTAKCPECGRRVRLVTGGASRFYYGNHTSKIVRKSAKVQS